MANIKISELTALTPPDAADLVPVTDSSASQTKRTTVGEIVGIVNGDVDVADDGTATISELPVSKLQDGDARQLLQTDAAGTGVEWTSNVDVPGTLDVTGATTLDSTLTVPLGSAAAPTVRFTGDTNTGIYSPGADQLALSTGGSERARIDSSGRLLVGTSITRSTAIGDPKLQVEGTTYGGSSIQMICNSAADAATCSHLAFGRSKTSSIGGTGQVLNGDRLGAISWNGAQNATLSSIAGLIECYVDGLTQTGGDTSDMPGRLVFSTTADGASSPTERMRLTSDGLLFCQGVYDYTTASSSNVNVFSNGHLSRNTSSLKYKTSVETMEDVYADAILQCRPVWYRSLCQADDPAHSYWGFIAEEVAQIDPRLIHWKTEESVVQDDGSRKIVKLETPEPDGVQYDRFVPHLLNLIKRQQQAIETLEAKVAALEGV